MIFSFQNRLKGQTVPVARLTPDSFLNAAVAEICGMQQRRLRAVSAQKLAAQGACKDVSRAVEHLVDIRLLDKTDLPVQSCQIPHPVSGFDTGDDGIFDLLCIQKRLVCAGEGQARQQGGLRPVRRDEIGEAAQLAHCVHVRVRKAVIERFTVAKHGIDDDERFFLREAADKLRGKADLLRCAAVAGHDAVKLDADPLPVRGEGAHAVRHVLHGIALKAAGVRG